MIEFAVSTGSVAEDVTNRHEEREKRVCVSRFSLITGTEVAEKCTTRSLEHIVSDVENPESNDEDSNCSGTDFFVEAVAKGMAEISGVAD